VRRSLPASVAVIAVVAAGIIGVQGAALTPAEAIEAPSSPSVPDALTAPDAASATQIATTYDHPVAIDSETTPQTIVSALANGEYRYESDTLPVRVRQGATWVDVNENLEAQPGGMLRPRVSASPVRFSGGNSDVLDQVQTRSGDWVTETWPYGNLPVPTVSGAVATYADVLPDVDIKLTATETGMSNVLVVKTDDAAADPRLQSLRLSISGATVAPAASDTLAARAPDGSIVVAGSPLWWDSSHGATAAGPAGDDPARPVAHTTDTSGMTLDVGKTVEATTPTYPVFVDPEWGSNDTHVWYTDAAFPSQTYYDANVGTDLRVGISAPYKSDMFFQFSLPAIAGATVSKAVINTQQVWSGTCSPTAIDVHMYGPKTAGFSWTTEQSYGSSPWGGILQSLNPNYGCSGVAGNTVGWTVTSGVQSKVTAGATYAQFAWTYHDPSSNVSRRHYSTSASIVIDYDRPPSTPSALKIQSPDSACGTAANPAVINAAQPLTLQATVSDPDAGAQVNANFYIYNAPGGVPSSTYLLEENTGGQPPGVLKETFTPPATPVLIDGQRYAWRVLAGDWTLLSAYSGYCYFDVDNTKPLLPQLTITANDSTFTVGQPLTVDITDTSPDVYGFESWIATGTATSPAAAAPVTWAAVAPNPAPARTCGAGQGEAWLTCATGGAASLDVAPTDATSVLWVSAYDKAGNVSTSAALQLFPSGGSGAQSQAGYFNQSWDLYHAASPLDTTIPSIPGGSVSPENLTIGGTLSRTQTGSIVSPGVGPMLAFPSTGAPTTGVATAPNTLDTTQSFSVSAWVTPATLTPSTVAAILAQSGTTRSGFLLVEAANGHAQFCMQPQSTGLPVDCVTSPAALTTAHPQLVSATWDRVNRQMRLYVGGSRVAVAPHVFTSGDVTAAGVLTVGSAQALGVAADQWQGTITNPFVAQGLLTQTDLISLSGVL